MFYEAVRFLSYSGNEINRKILHQSAQTYDGKSDPRSAPVAEVWLVIDRAVEAIDAAKDVDRHVREL